MNPLCSVYVYVEKQILCVLLLLELGIEHDISQMLSKWFTTVLYPQSQNWLVNEDSFQRFHPSF